MLRERARLARAASGERRGEGRKGERKVECRRTQGEQSKICCAALSSSIAALRGSILDNTHPVEMNCISVRLFRNHVAARTNRAVRAGAAHSRGSMEPGAGAECRRIGLWPLHKGVLPLGAVRRSWGVSSAALPFSASAAAALARLWRMPLSCEQRGMRGARCAACAHVAIGGGVDLCASPDAE